MPPLAFNGDSFKKDKVQALSLAGGMTAATAPQDAIATSVLPQIAAKTPASAVDLLFTERITRANAQGMPLSDADVKAFVAAVGLLDPGDPAALAGGAERCRIRSPAAPTLRRRRGAWDRRHSDRRRQECRRSHPQRRVQRSLRRRRGAAESAGRHVPGGCLPLPQGRRATGGDPGKGARRSR
jgi:hypothetical protein